jgi:D-alanyl-D-alanine carboxypeptidase
MLRPQRIFFLMLWGLMAGPPPSNARSYASVVMGEDGVVLHSTYGDKTVYPASLTKMMLLYLAFESLRSKKLKLTETLTFSPHAHRQPPCRLDIKPGEKISVGEAISAIVTKSSNNVSVALGERLAFSEARCARLMSQKAKKLGLGNTVFRNTTGLFHPEQVTTAHDMARLGRALLRDFPEQYKYFSTRNFRFRGKIYRSHNRVLGKVEGADGIKTGFLSISGFNTVVSVKQPGRRRLFVAVIGGKTSAWRDQHVAELVQATYEMPHHVPLVMAKALPSKNLSSLAAALAKPYGSTSLTPHTGLDKLFAKALVAS